MKLSPRSCPPAWGLGALGPLLLLPALAWVGPAHAKGPRAPDAGLHEAALLDAAKGASARDAYRAWLGELCKAASGAARSEALGRVGLGDDACMLVDGGHAVASGAFLQAGADEVLLVVPSGLDAAAGNSTLALMRKDAGAYQLVMHMARARGFSAHVRIAGTSGTDHLFVCAEAGNMGTYPSRCGFLGVGAFRRGEELAPDEASRDELDLLMIDSTECGTHTSVALGAIAMHGDALRVELALGAVAQQKAAGDEAGVCSRRVPTKRQHYHVDFRFDPFDGMRFRRTTPVPPEIEKALRSEG